MRFGAIWQTVMTVTQAGKAKEAAGEEAEGNYGWVWGAVGSQERT